MGFLLALLNVYIGASELAGDGIGEGEGVLAWRGAAQWLLRNTCGNLAISHSLKVNFYNNQEPRIQNIFINLNVKRF